MTILKYEHDIPKKAPWFKMKIHFATSDMSHKRCSPFGGNCLLNVRSTNNWKHVNCKKCLARKKG